MANPYDRASVAALNLSMDAPDFASMGPGDRGPALRSYVQRYLVSLEDPAARPVTTQACNRRLFAIYRLNRSAEEHETVLPTDLAARVLAAANTVRLRAPRRQGKPTTDPVLGVDPPEHQTRRLRINDASA